MKIDLDKPIYLIGAGGHCRSVFDILRRIGAKIGGYFDSKNSEWLEELGVSRIDDSLVVSLCKEEHQFCLSFLGKDVKELSRRLHIMKEYKSFGAKFPSIIHPSVILSSYSKIEEGVQIFAGSIINANTFVKEGAVINTGCIIEHDAIIGEGTHMAPGSSVLGQCEVGDFCYVGAGSIIIQCQKINNESFLKAGSVYWK